MPELKRFNNLRKKIVEVMYQLLTKCLTPTNQMVKNLVMIEDSYINTHHPDFMGGANAMLNVFDPKSYRDRDEFGLERKISFEDIAERPRVPNLKMSQQNNGLFSSWFGGPSNNVQIEENVEGMQMNDVHMNYRNEQEYEISKYMNKNHSPVALP